MKYILIFLVSILSIASELQQPDKEKPLYQKKWGGTVIAWPMGDVDEVAWPKPESIEEAKLRIEIERLEQDIKDERELKQAGRREMKYGVMALIAGIIIAVILAHYGFELVGGVIALGGVWFIISGAITIKLAGNITMVAIGGGLVLVIVLVGIFTHKKGIKFKPFIRKLKELNDG